MNVVVHLPADCSLPHPMAGTLARQAFSRRITIEEAGHDRYYLVTFPDLPQYIDLALQLIAESVRIPGAWASIDGQRMSSLMALWNRLDCYRQSLDAPDPKVFCRGKVADLFAQHGCRVECCEAPCQFLCRPCGLIDQDNTTPVVMARVQVLAVLGEIDWCPNLRRSPRPVT